MEIRLHFGYMTAMQTVASPLMPIPGHIDPVPVPRSLKPRADGRIDLLGLSKADLRMALETSQLEPKQAKLRAKQLWHWIYNRGVTDFSLMTANPEIGNDVHLIFQQLSGLAAPLQLRHLMQSPFTLHSGVLERIEREAAHARAGKPGRIVAKMNALNEPQVIRALYDASRAGVEVDLVVRGACTLLPGIEGVSGNIRVRSIVGRFLEHHRVWWFGNDGDPDLFCSSADWLERNLLRRVETAFPIFDADCAQRVHREGLLNYLDDNQNAWELGSDGGYRKIAPTEGEAPFSAQLSLLAGLYA